MSDTEHNGLPRRWALAKLGDLIGKGGLFCDGDWVETKDQDPNGDVRLIQLADVGDGWYRDKSSRFLTSEKAAELRCTYLAAGDVLIARMPDPLGRACTFPGDPKSAITAVDVCIVRTGEPGVDHRWLIHTVNSPQFRACVAAYQSGSTRKRISRRNLAKIEFPVPPPAEQARIADKIEELFTDLDAGVAALERVERNLERYRASVLKAAVEGKLTEAWRAEHPDVEPASVLLDRILAERRRRWEAAQLAKYEAKGRKPPKGWKDRCKEPESTGIAGLSELPQGWSWAQIARIGEVKLGRQRSPKNRSKDYPTKYIRAANITEAGLDLDDVMEMEFRPNEFEVYQLREGDLLVSEASGSPDQVGKPALWGGEIQRCCFQNTVIRLRPVLLSSRYVLNVLRHYYASGVFARAAAGVGLNHLGATRFAALSFPLAPPEEQERIADEAEERLSVIDELAKAVHLQGRRAPRLRQAILKRAFEGRLVPQDPSDEPASTLLERIRAGRAKGTKGRKGKKRSKKGRARQKELWDAPAE